MQAHVASLINAITLVAMGAWGYMGSDEPSPTALIPVFFGVVIFVLNRGLKIENKVVAHIVVVLTLLIMLALFMPFKAAMGRGDNMAMIRIGLMILTSAFAFILFIKSFIAARKAKG